MDVVDLGSNAGFFMATTTTPVQPEIVTPGVIAPTNGGVKQRPISTLSVISTAKNSNSQTASPLDSISVSSGVGSTTNKYIKTSTPYRVVFDGEGTYYDVDYGVITFPDEDFNPSTGEYLFDMGTVTIVATIDDMLNESLLTGGYVNGETSDLTRGTAELGTDISSGNTDNLTYDESAGDGQFYIKPTLSASGAYKELRDAVMCFEWDTSTPPEGNEISSIVYQRNVLV